MIPQPCSPLRLHSAWRTRHAGAPRWAGPGAQKTGARQAGVRRLSRRTGPPGARGNGTRQACARLVSRRAGPSGALGTAWRTGNRRGENWCAVSWPGEVRRTATCERSQDAAQGKPAQGLAHGGRPRRSWARQASAFGGAQRAVAARGMSGTADAGALGGAQRAAVAVARGSWAPRADALPVLPARLLGRRPAVGRRYICGVPARYMQ